MTITLGPITVDGVGVEDRVDRVDWTLTELFPVLFPVPTDRALMARAGSPRRRTLPSSWRCLCGAHVLTRRDVRTSDPHAATLLQLVGHFYDHEWRGTL